MINLIPSGVNQLSKKIAICECISPSCTKQWSAMEGYALGYMDASNFEDYYTD